MNGSSMRTISRGFSLIELMVTVAILGIIALVVAPAFQSMRESARVRSAAEAIYAHVQFARTESIKQDRNIFVAVGTGTDWCVGIANATGCDCGTAGECQFGPDSALMEHNLQGADFPGTSVASNPTDYEFDSRRGTTNGGGGTITVSDASGHSASVVISNLGRARLCGNVGGYQAC